MPAIWAERWLAHLLAWLWGAPTARRSLRLATRLYATPNFQARWRRCRFVLRTIWYGRSSAAWFRFLDANAFRRRLVRQQPELAEKLHRPYRRCDIDTGARLACLVSHTLALEHKGWQQRVLDLSTRPLQVARFVGKDELEWRLELAHAGQFMKEGELCLHLRCGGRRMYSAAFSFRGPSAIPTGAPAWALDIGCLQGPCDPAARDQVRGATKAMHGLRPRDLMLTAAKALAEALRVPSLVGVANSRHVYRHWRKRRAFAFDYDGFWAEHASQLRADGDYELSPAYSHKPIEQFASNKRGEARRRFAMVADIRRQINQAMGAT